MSGYDWITLTTDYGLSDGFVAMVHGVLAREAPHDRVLDVTHLVAPQDVARGAAVLAQAVPHLPVAVHVAVVDPGVGSSRRGVALRTPGGLLVGPDNGLLLAAATALGGITEAVNLDNTGWHAPTVSPTFHGRDIFAPVAARLAGGGAVNDAGSAIDPSSLHRLPEPHLDAHSDYLDVEVLTVDQFGNVQLAATAETLAGWGDALRVGALPARRGSTFADGTPGELLVLLDSADRIAVAVFGGNAAHTLGVSPGDLVRVTPNTPAR